MMTRRNVVLIVDDDPDIREIVAVILDLHGVPTLPASDGTEALFALRASTDIGLVLLDLMMPRMSGLEVLAEMKRDPALDDIPVVVISGNFHEESIALGMGAREYLLKPLDAATLIQAVARYVPIPERRAYAAPQPTT